MKFLDKKEIKNIVEKVLEIDLSNLEKLGENGYKTVKEKYGWDKIVGETYDEYKKLIG